MTARSALRVDATALCSVALLAGCGSATSPTVKAPSSARSSPSAATSSAASGTANKALTVALSPSDLPSPASSFTQSSDGLLASTPNTDARVFASSDGTTKVEIDLAVDTSASAATTDYTAYNSAAQKQVATQTSQSTPSIGTQANEYVGTAVSGNSVVSLAFAQGSVICVVTMVMSGGAGDAAVAEAIAKAQVQKVSAAGL
ncbi:MAG: hypothetical protein JF887_10375 [Candidatus Dormibacteraeota bacterium]|uniref:Uncharacterized protein n=1 Tax=Candidatus Amunia macphersoniae TaxID=3127014 RepID=A0A934NGD2_9BACT|nr:hypothetical protein [Candidatus Dormibacteraeota bacterium]